MAIKMSDFLQTYMGSNHNVDDLEVWVYDPPATINEDGESYKIKKSIRNYLIFGDYYVADITIDWYPNRPHKNPILSLSIVKEPQDVFQSCPFTYEH